MNSTTTGSSSATRMRCRLTRSVGAEKLIVNLAPGGRPGVAGSGGTCTPRISPLPTAARPRCWSWTSSQADTTCRKESGSADDECGACELPGCRHVAENRHGEQIGKHDTEVGHRSDGR